MLCKKKGILNSLKAYGYATVICSGPMLLGVLLLLGIMFLCSRAGVETQTRELLICMITYTLLASIIVTSFFTMAITRFTADMLYEEKKSAVLPSFWGSSALMMTFGSVLWGIFLAFSGANLMCAILMFIFFNEMIIVWNAMGYLTAIKDYRGIFLSYLVSIIVIFVLGFVLTLIFKSHIIEMLLLSVTVGYGVMVIWNLTLLHRYFPKSDVGAFVFLEWIDEYLYLALSGLFVNVGMFSHLVIMWFSKVGVRVHGLFYGAPEHDVPDEAGDNVIRAFGKMKYFIKSKTVRKGVVEMAVEVYCKNNDTFILEKIRAVEGVEDVTLIQYNGEYHG